jgi:hypothetical protein
MTRNDAKNNAGLTRGFPHTLARGERPCRTEPSRSQLLSDIQGVLRLAFAYVLGTKFSLFCVI